MENSNLDILRHSTSHVMAQAIKRLYKKAKLAIGPSIKDGFYYDFEIDEKLSPEDFKNIEAEMQRIINEKLPIIRKEVSRDEALKLMENLGETYKIELINDIPAGEKISLYSQGEFTDLCAGPHIENTKDIKAFKLLSVAGAYWRGSEKNKMLQRVYGTAFETKQELNEHILKLEEAKKRDHVKLGRELELFTTVDIIGKGLPILMPKGARVVQLLQRFVEDEEQKRGYLLTKTPLMAKSDLYKISGHWQHYREGMFIMGDEKKDDEVFALRPMTCPFQFQHYLNKTRSYRDLPMRLAETSTLFRNEQSGEMHGLIRVRQFTISEGHIACTKSQLENEFKECVALAKFMLKTVGLDGDVSYRFSKWDESNKEKYIGSANEWNAVQNAMEDILKTLSIDYSVGIGEAAFYGPKLDVQIKNVHGKEDTLITIQIDFQLAKRFNMEYTDENGEILNPYIIHRTSLGCYERTLALLIEKFAGAFPTWLAPVQIKVIPVSEKQAEYAKNIAEKLAAAGIRVESDLSSEKLGYKLRLAITEKIPYAIVIGDRELEQKTITVRNRSTGKQTEMKIEEFILALHKEIEAKELTAKI